jgi:flavin reductase (DIM6/NTAB) family NADH-FMN oxidoreductase RutF
MKKDIHYTSNCIEDMEKRERVNFINSLSGFKSCNLLGTISNSGKVNLAVISSAFHIGANPSLLGFIMRPDSVPRHSLENIRETKICTLNHVSSDFFEKAHQTSARYERDISEFSACKLEEEFKANISAPFVKESKIKMSLELVREIHIEENNTHMLICKITNVFMSDYYVKSDGTIDIETARTVCVSGINTYHKTEILKVMDYAKPKL